ncbi:tRNA pseudouridine synthase B [Thermovibrio ammonificans HB-1]|uniref:tRNA pseudouridine synthase B n=1 Tax=Thermovibrio ammonificans (strain DSM 15698 / JCM 12110 / HB-1) TaxID=648996 RepID=E8T1X7_THEA1|nr:tRNA pseudouridine(55) synthase TruB [Thermovibrio ammonificans]ADU96872.1 tRNA pseudouridine synthase B [Thermovibrio ammonificans HB-1]
MGVAGFLPVDKPSGITSHDVVDRVRKLLPRRTKVGHTGTLDPLATGLLVLAVGKATKFSQFLLKQDKCYTVEGELGLSSPTYDVDGEVVSVPCPPLSEEELQSALSRFVGEIEQTPPPFSAVRIKGKRAYQLAREGKEFTLPKRRVTVYSLKLLSFSFPRFSLEVCCSSGTYIRSLVHDIGLALGTDAVVTSLRRTKVGNLSVESAVKLSELNRENLFSYLLPVESLLPFPHLSLSDKEAEDFRHGRRFSVSAPDGTYSVCSSSGFLGVGEVVKGQLRPLRVM